MSFLSYKRGRTAVVLLVLLGALTVPVPASAEEAVTLSDRIGKCIGHYVYGEFDEGIALANELLTRSDLTAQDSVAIYEALSILTYAKGDEYHRKSVDYLNVMSRIGPCVIHLPRELWPPELRNKWYEITNGTDAFTCGSESMEGVKTIAVMEFDNFSVQKYQEKLGPIGKGLADWFEHDFGKISELTVVERDKVNFVLQELELQKSGQVDKATAVKAGKLLGAQYMVFGSITQLDDDHTGMVVRVVSVETSEIIASVDKRGKPEYSKLEQELVVELADQLNIMLGDEVKEMIEEGGTESLDATTFYSKGLEYSDRYDYKQAYEYFKKAYELDSSFTKAKKKMDLLAPLAV
jgi:TolB-like protein